MAVVTSGNHHHGVGLFQIVQELLVHFAPCQACVAGAQGQVHAVTAQDNGVFQGGKVVRLISAAGDAEDLHHQDLRIRGVAHHASGSGRFPVAALAVGDVPVGVGDACHVGAVTALHILVMGQVEAVVNVVISKGHLGAGVELLGGDGGLPPVGVQLGQNLSNLSSVQQVLLPDEVLHRHAGLLGVFRNGVVKGAGVKGLMVQHQAGVDDGNPGACAGVAQLPDLIGPVHLGGDGHAGGGVRPLLGDRGGILGLQHHVLDARNFGNLLHLPIGNIGGDDVGRQGQVPDHVQGLAVQGLLLNGCGYGCLAGLQAAPIGGSCRVAANGLGGEAGRYRGLLLQNNGYADGIRVAVSRWLQLSGFHTR